MRMMLPLEPCQGTQWSGSMGDELVGNLGGVCGGVGRCTQAPPIEQAEQPSRPLKVLCETCMQCCPLMCVLQGLIRAQTMRWHHLAKWCAHFCKMGVLEAWHQIDTSVKQAEQARQAIQSSYSM